MEIHTCPKEKLPGYEEYGTIKICYRIPKGKQGKEHPNPVHYFTGTSHTAYLPEGRKVLQLLRKAFDARLIFTVGTSQDKYTWWPNKVSCYLPYTFPLLIIVYYYIVMATQTLHI